MTSALTSFDDARWVSFARHWNLRPGTTYLNHGSFGPPPDQVRAERLRWIAELDAQPMDFFVRQFEPAWMAARNALAKFVGTNPENLIFVENATVGMNVVADSFPLHAEDEVLLTDHEYGAVVRIWQRACERQGAKVATAQIPLPVASVEETVEAIFAAVNDHTRMIVVSHITSPTAIILPVKEICDRARHRGIAVCIDGPHAPAQIPVDIASLGCDFYAASCHKWLCAPFGSGFLSVAPQHQSLVRPSTLSWGRIPPTKLESWSDEFCWSGTRDSSPYLSIPVAITFMQSVGLEFFRSGAHSLARYARQRLVELTGLEPIIPDSPEWYGSMAHVPLPPGEQAPLQNALWQQHGIEVPIVEFLGRRYIRVSCHLYNTTGQIDRLITALATLLQAGL